MAEPLLLSAPGVEPVVWVPTEALGHETLPPGQALPTPSDREPQFPQEAPGASSHRPALTPTALLTTALNPPTAASAGPALSPGTAQATQQQLLGVTASNLPEHPTEALASKGVTAGHSASPGAPEPSSLPLSQHAPGTDTIQDPSGVAGDVTSPPPGVCYLCLVQLIHLYRFSLS